MIPATIHYIWLGRPMTIEQINYIYSNVISLSPGFDCIIWTDKPTALVFNLLNTGRIDVRNVHEIINRVDSKFASILLREIYGCFNNYAAASDVLRLLVLKLYGGLYLDVDVSLKREMYPEDIQSASKFTVFYHPLETTNAFIASDKGNVITEALLNKIVTKYQTGLDSWVTKRSGAIMLRLLGTIAYSGPNIFKDFILTNPVGYFPQDLFFPSDASSKWANIPTLLRADSCPNIPNITAPFINLN